MRTIDALRRSGIGIRPDNTVHEAAAVMELAGVGALAVVEGTTPVGIATDRDLTRRVLARKLAPDTRVDAVMTSPVVTIGADAGLHDAFGILRGHDVRRLPVIRDGQFVGMITVDDLLVDLANDLADLSGPIGAQIHRAQRNSAVPTMV